MKELNAAALGAVASRLTAPVTTDGTPADFAWRNAFVAAIKADTLEKRQAAAAQREFRKMLANG